MCEWYKKKIQVYKAVEGSSEEEFRDEFPHINLKSFHTWTDSNRTLT